MKRLGVIGGIGPESTVVYYRSLIAAGRGRLRRTSPPLVINSVDVQTILRLAEENPYQGCEITWSPRPASSRVAVLRLR